MMRLQSFLCREDESKRDTSIQVKRREMNVSNSEPRPCALDSIILLFQYNRMNNVGNEELSFIIWSPHTAPPHHRITADRKLLAACRRIELIYIVYKAEMLSTTFRGSIGACTRNGGRTRQLSQLLSAIEEHPATPAVTKKTPSPAVITSSTLANGIKIISRQTGSPVRSFICGEIHFRLRLFFSFTGRKVQCAFNSFDRL